MNNLKLILDIKTIPDGWDGQGWIDIMKEQNIVFYDGTKGNIPTVVNVEESDIEVIDCSTEEGKKLMNKITK